MRWLFLLAKVKEINQSFLIRVSDKGGDCTDIFQSKLLNKITGRFFLRKTDRKSKKSL